MVIRPKTNVGAPELHIFEEIEPLELKTGERPFKFKRGIRAGSITGEIYYDQQDNPARVIAKFETCTLVIDRFNGGKDSTFFQITDTGLSIEATPAPDGFEYYIRGMNRRSIMRAARLFDTVAKPLLAEFGVETVMGWTPNHALAKLLKKYFGAKLEGKEMSLRNMVHYEQAAEKGLADERFVGSNVEYKVTIPIKR